MGAIVIALTIKVPVVVVNYGAIDISLKVMVPHILVNYGASIAVY